MTRGFSTNPSFPIDSTWCLEARIAKNWTDIFDQIKKKNMSSRFVGFHDYWRLLEALLEQGQ